MKNNSNEILVQYLTFAISILTLSSFSLAMGSPGPSELIPFNNSASHFRSRQEAMIIRWNNNSKHTWNRETPEQHKALRELICNNTNKLNYTIDYLNFYPDELAQTLDESKKQTPEKEINWMAFK